MITLNCTMGEEEDESLHNLFLLSNVHTKRAYLHGKDQNDGLSALELQLSISFCAL